MNEFWDGLADAGAVISFVVFIHWLEASMFENPSLFDRIKSLSHKIKHFFKRRSTHDD